MAKKRKSFNTELRDIIDRYGGRSLKTNNVRGDNTRATYRRDLKLIFNDLRYKIGQKIETPYSLKGRHIKTLVKYWEDKPLAASTITNRISKLRWLADVMGKKGMVEPVNKYVSDPDNFKVRTVTTEDKSWIAKGVNVGEVLNGIYNEDVYVGIQCELQLAYGLRRLESMLFTPHLADQKTFNVLTRGTKGGRDRITPIETEYQRLVLNIARNMVNPGKSMIPGDCTEKQWINRYHYILRKCGITKNELGVTGHGLRHQYANDRYEHLLGEKSPVRKFTHLDERPLRKTDRKYQLSEEIGHSRESILGAYCGSNAELLKTTDSQSSSNEQDEGDRQYGFTGDLTKELAKNKNRRQLLEKP